MGKILSIDLDGTLLDNNEKIPESTIKYLNILRRENNLVVISTGRFLNSAINITNSENFTDYIISDAGAVIYDSLKNEIIYEENLNTNDCKEIFQNAILNNCKEIKIYTSSNLYRYSKNSTFQEYSKINEFKDLREYQEKITHMAIHFYDNDSVYKFIDYYSNINKKEKILKDTKLYLMKDFTSSYVWVDAFKINIDKYSGLLHLLDFLNKRKEQYKYNFTNEDIICFGDGSNDLEMLKNSKISVAMGNAFDEIKSVAKYITYTNDEKGVERWLKEFKGQLI